MSGTRYVLTAEGGTAGANVTKATSGADVIVVNNADVSGSGATGLTYAASAALRGALGFLSVPQANQNQIRKTLTDTGRRWVLRRPLTWAVRPASSITVMYLRPATGWVAQLYLNPSGTLTPYVQTVAYTAGSSTWTYTPGSTFWLELMVLLESASGAGDGQVGYQVTDTAGNVVATYTSPATLSTGTTPPTAAYWVTPASTVLTSGNDPMDDLAVQQLDSGWLGAANQAPTVSLPAVVSAMPGAAVSVTAAASDDGTIASYVWAATTFTTTGQAAATVTGSDATVQVTAGAAGTLTVVQVTVTDDGGLTASAATEIRVPVAATGGTATLRPLAVVAPVTTGTWTRAGSAASDGAALADELATTYVESAAVSATAQTHRHRLQPAPTGVSQVVVTESVAVDTGSLVATARLYEGATLRKQGAATTVSSTSGTDVTATWVSGTDTAIGDPGALWAEVSLVAA